MGVGARGGALTPGGSARRGFGAGGDYQPREDSFGISTTFNLNVI